MIKVPEHLKSVSQVGVYDNAGGNSSATCNKTSAYLVHKHEGIKARIVNISCWNIDGHGSLVELDYPNIDDFALWYGIVIEVITRHVKFYEKENYRLVMNARAYEQLVEDWFREREVQYPCSFESFMGIRIEIDASIQENEEPVL